MPYNLRLPDGSVIQNIPDGVSHEQVKQLAIRKSLVKESAFELPKPEAEEPQPISRELVKDDFHSFDSSKDKEQEKKEKVVGFIASSGVSPELILENTDETIKQYTNNPDETIENLYHTIDVQIMNTDNMTLDERANMIADVYVSDEYEKIPVVSTEETKAHIDELRKQADIQDAINNFKPLTDENVFDDTLIKQNSIAGQDYSLSFQADGYNLKDEPPIIEDPIRFDLNKEMQPPVVDENNNQLPPLYEIALEEEFLDLPTSERAFIYSAEAVERQPWLRFPMSAIETFLPDWMEPEFSRYSADSIGDYIAEGGGTITGFMGSLYVANNILGAGAKLSSANGLSAFSKVPLKKYPLRGVPRLDRGLTTVAMYSPRAAQIAERGLQNTVVFSMVNQTLAPLDTSIEDRYKILNADTIYGFAFPALGAFSKLAPLGKNPYGLPTYLGISYGLGYGLTESETEFDKHINGSIMGLLSLVSLGVPYVNARKNLVSFLNAMNMDAKLQPRREELIASWIRANARNNTANPKQWQKKTNVELFVESIPRSEAMVAADKFSLALSQRQAVQSHVNDWQGRTWRQRQNNWKKEKKSISDSATMAYENVAKAQEGVATKANAPFKVDVTANQYNAYLDATRKLYSNYDGLRSPVGSQINPAKNPDPRIKLEREATKSQLSKLNWNDIRAKAKSLGLPAKGKKQELIQKITDSTVGTSNSIVIQSTLDTLKKAGSVPDENGNILVTHNSPVPALTEIKKEFAGTNPLIFGAERKRSQVLPKTFFGLPDYTKEFKADYEYTALIPANNLYSFDKDPLGIRPLSMYKNKPPFPDVFQADVFEEKLVEMGFKGYIWNMGDKRGHAVVMFDNVFVKQDLSKVFVEAPVQKALDLAVLHKKKLGLPVELGNRILTISEPKAMAIADAYETMKHDPFNPAVREAYEALANETLAQYKLMQDAGYKVEIFDGLGEPYKNSKEMIRDLRENNHMWIFGTEAGYGQRGITAKQREENPMLAVTKYKDVNGKPLLINDLFRAIHDFFGHAQRGNAFGALGEENAWDVHSKMFTFPARRAMTTETRGQNSWVNYGKQMRREDGSLIRKGEDGYLKQTERAFAPQKIGLMPEEFTMTEQDAIPDELIPLLNEVDSVVNSVIDQQWDDVVSRVQKLEDAGIMQVDYLDELVDAAITENYQQLANISKQVSNSEVIDDMVLAVQENQWETLAELIQNEIYQNVKIPTTVSELDSFLDQRITDDFVGMEKAMAKEFGIIEETEPILTDSDKLFLEILEQSYQASIVNDYQASLRQAYELSRVPPVSLNVINSHAEYVANLIDDLSNFENGTTSLVDDGAKEGFTNKTHKLMVRQIKALKRGVGSAVNHFRRFGAMYVEDPQMAREMYRLFVQLQASPELGMLEIHKQLKDLGKTTVEDRKLVTQAYEAGMPEMLPAELIPIYNLVENFYSKLEELQIDAGVLERSFAEDQELRIERLLKKAETAKPKKREELLAKADSLSMIQKYVSHVELAKLMSEISETSRNPIKFRKRLEQYHSKREGVKSLNDYYEAGIIQAEDMDIVRLLMSSAVSAHTKIISKKFVDMGLESGYIISDKDYQKLSEYEQNQFSRVSEMKAHVKMPQPEKTYIHRLYESALEDVTGVYDPNYSTFRRVLNIVKLGQFVDPTIIGLYNILQALYSGSIPINPKTLSKNIAKAMRSVASKDEEFVTAMKNGAFAKQDLVNRREYEKLLHTYSNKTKLHKGNETKERVSRIFQTVFGISKPEAEAIIQNKDVFGAIVEIITPIHKHVGTLTWKIDEIQRMTTFYNVKALNKKITDEEAGELVADIHGNYTKVSPRFKQWAPLLFFVYSFRMLMPWNYNIKPTYTVLRQAINKATGNKYESYKVRDAAYKIGLGLSIPFALDALLRSQGWEDTEEEELSELGKFREEYLTVDIGDAKLRLAFPQYKYKKVVQTVDGEKEIVLPISNIMNMVTKWGVRLTQPKPEDFDNQLLMAVTGTMQYEVNPAYPLLYDLINNQGDFGESPPFGNDGKDILGGIHYALRKSLRAYDSIYKLVNKGILKEDEGQKIINEQLNAIEKFFATFGYAYVRDSFAERLQARYAKVNKTFKSRAYPLKNNTNLNTPEQNEKELERLVKLYEEALEELNAMENWQSTQESINLGELYK